MARNLQISATVQCNHATENSDVEDDLVKGAVPERKTLEGLLYTARIFLFLLATLLIGIGSVSLFYCSADEKSGEDLVVDARVKSFGGAPPWKRVAVTFTLTNRSARSIRVVGMAPFCGRHGCLALDNLPLDVPPLSSRDFVVFVDTKEPGQLSSELKLFSDSPVQTQTVLRINGRIVESDGKL
jgi:hypothetical protein